MDTNREFFKQFPLHRPDHLRLCYVYHPEWKWPKKAHAVVAMYDQDEDGWFDALGNHMPELHVAGLRWVHLPLISDYADNLFNL